jgi:hypothetical protein
MQGIDYSIANHLKHLTEKWVTEDQLDINNRRIYKRGEEICKEWASKKSNDKYEDSSHSSSTSYYTDSEEESSLDYGLNEPLKIEENSEMVQKTENRRYKFDTSMVDMLGHVIIVKVYSHQLDKNFAIKSPDMQPMPNLFIPPGNQIADNAATQAKEITNHQLEDLNQIFYPPFSPRWCFSFEGCITNKGATKVWHEKVDEELSLRLQHRNKEGAF